jgi:hypothetical protein
MMSLPWRLLVLRISIITLIAAALFFGWHHTVSAGFGITPPYVRNDRLTRGTVYEQRITLVRSDPIDELKAEISMNIPGVEAWFTVDRGNTFLLPAGETQVPIIISVRVPEDAEYMKHQGTIRIRTSSSGKQPGGGVSIALGAQIDVAIEVVDKIYDFNVRRIRTADLEEGRKKWGLYFPAKIRFFMTIENTGNAVFGPTSVRFDIYDAQIERLLETTENTNDIEQLEPFAIKEIIAEIPTRLPAGRYVAKYTIFKNDEVAQQNQINLSVAAIGAVQGYTGYGFDGLSFTDKLKVFGVCAVPILVLVALVSFILIRRRRVGRDQHIPMQRF